MRANNLSCNGIQNKPPGANNLRSSGIQNMNVSFINNMIWRSGQHVRQNGPWRNRKLPLKNTPHIQRRFLKKKKKKKGPRSSISFRTPSRPFHIVQQEGGVSITFGEGMVPESPSTFKRHFMVFIWIFSAQVQCCSWIANGALRSEDPGRSYKSSAKSQAGTR